MESKQLGYFATHRNQLHVDGYFENQNKGLREAQAGAYWAVRSHFTTQSTPAIVVMPTGSGKTTVMTLLAFAIVKKRVLIIAPSRVIRDQIKNEFLTLERAKNVGVLNDAVYPPKVTTVERQLKTHEDWIAQEEFDVVVATPKCVSPAEGNVYNFPPVDQFDTIFIDEAHHLPAQTWNGLLEYFSSVTGVRVVAYTATPFRSDKRLIPGQIVYNYPLSRALESKIYRPVDMIGISAIGDANAKDKALAQKASEVFNQEQRKGKLLVRVGSLKETERIKKLYQEYGIALDIVTHKQEHMEVKKTIERVRSDSTCHGLITVGMMSEGLDIPQLYIGVLHSAFQSLPITLQFIGRLCRISAQLTAEKPAQLLAITEDLNSELYTLFASDTGWNKLIQIAEQRVVAAIKQKSSMSDLKPTLDRLDLLPEIVRPYFSVNVYETSTDIRLEEVDFEAFMPKRSQLVQDWNSESRNLRIFVSYHREKPTWTTSETLTSHKYELGMYYVKGSFLFELASSGIVAAAFRKALGEGNIRKVQKSLLENVLAQSNVKTYYGLGMRRSSMATAAVPQYKMHYGRDAENTIRQSDGQFFSNGHVVAQVLWDGSEMVMGVSGDNGRIWISTKDEIGKFIEWCDSIADLISNHNEATLPYLSHLKTSQIVDEFPQKPYTIVFNEKFYQQMESHLAITIFDGTVWNQFDVSRAELAITEKSWDESQPHICEFSFNLDENSISLSCDLSKGFKVNNHDPGNCYVRLNEDSRHREYRLEDYLSEFPPQIFLVDGSSIIGNSWTPFTPASYDLPDDLFIPLNWNTYNTNIKVEDADKVKDTQKFDESGQRSVIQSTQMYLSKKYPSAVIFSDHRTGEIADFIVIDRPSPNSKIELHFFHCKASSDPKPGLRLGDLYEVLGQAQKSIRWIHKPRLFDKIRECLERQEAIKGGITKYERMIGNSADISPVMNTNWTIHLVQPGFSISKFKSQSEAKTEEYRILLLKLKESLSESSSFRVIGST